MTAKLTYREAARRVQRSTRAIKRWRQHGMTMTWERRAGQLCRVVDEETLLAWWRTRLQNDPVHQARLEARRANPLPSEAWTGTSS